MVHVAKRYGVSDVALAKTCRKLRVPKPGVGYWAKMAHGHETKKPPLPEFQNAPRILPRGCTSLVEREPQPAPERLAPEAFEKSASLIRKEQAADMRIRVPDDLSDMHPFVRNTSRQFKKRMKNNYCAIDYGRIQTSGVDVFNVNVSPGNFERALLILQGLCNAFSLRNIEIRADEERTYMSSSPRIQIMDVDLTFKLFEPSRRKVRQDSGRASSYKQYDYTPTGVLQFEIGDCSYHNEYRTRWRDTKRRQLEDQLNGIIEGLFTAAAWEHERNARVKKREEEWAIELAKREERERLARINGHRIAMLENGLEQYSRYLKLRGYLYAVREEALTRVDSIALDSEIAKWLSWAEQHIESVNPLKGELPVFSVGDPGMFFGRKRSGFD
jgi:hypothetical protein